MENLIPIIYDELNQIAQRHLAKNRSNHTLQATALVHEVFIKLAGAENKFGKNKSHFLALASRIMRQVLIDYARNRNALKRGGEVIHVTLTQNLLGSEEFNIELLDLEKALVELGKQDARKEEIVVLRFLGALTLEETAAVMKCSVPTIKREWRFARAWLVQYMKRGSHD